MAPQLLPGPFTVDLYHRLGELGILDEDDRVELLDGQIVELPPIGPGHGGSVNGLNRILARLGGGPRHRRGTKPPRAGSQVRAPARCGAPEAAGATSRSRATPPPTSPGAWLVDLTRETILRCREGVTVARGQTLQPLLLPGVTITAESI